MISAEYLLDNKDKLEETANRLTGEDVDFLISLLPEKNDELRYQAFLTLQKRSELFDDVYPHWETFAAGIDSDNSYQRSIGIMLIAVNMKWDNADRFSEIAEKYLSHCNDAKPITSRLTLQSIAKWIAAKPQYWDLVKETLFRIDIEGQRDTMKKLILLDIIGVLAEIQKTERYDDITAYLVNAMTGGILDKKSISQVERYL